MFPKTHSMKNLKWERTLPIRNAAYYGYIVSSDYYKYQQVPWQFMEGRANMYLLLAFEYQRMWIKERELWQKKMRPPEANKVDLVKKYVLSFKAKPKPPKEEKKTFKMKQFQNVQSKTVSKRDKDSEKKEKIEDQCTQKQKK